MANFEDQLRIGNIGPGGRGGHQFEKVAQGSCALSFETLKLPCRLPLAEPVKQVAVKAIQTAATRVAEPVVEGTTKAVKSVAAGLISRVLKVLTGGRLG
jgi:hypothetical protein